MASVFKQIGFNELMERHPEATLRMVAGFVTELIYDPYCSVNAKAIECATVEGFLVQMKQNINPAMAIKNPVSYWKKCFINFVEAQQAHIATLDLQIAE